MKWYSFLSSFVYRRWSTWPGPPPADHIQYQLVRTLYPTPMGMRNEKDVMISSSSFLSMVDCCIVFLPHLHQLLVRLYLLKPGLPAKSHRFYS